MNKQIITASLGILGIITLTGCNTEENHTNINIIKSIESSPSPLKITSTDFQERFVQSARILHDINPNTATDIYMPLEWDILAEAPKLPNELKISYMDDTIIEIERTKTLSDIEISFYNYYKENGTTVQDDYTKSLEMEYRRAAQNEPKTYYTLGLTGCIGYGFLGLETEQEEIYTEYSAFLQQQMIYQVLVNENIQEYLFNTEDEFIKKYNTDALYLFNNFDDKTPLGKMKTVFAFDTETMTLTTTTTFSKVTEEILAEFQALTIDENHETEELKIN